MNFKILEYIVAIAETGNVTKAAERLFISQSGLNQQLIKLETELGTPLFHRSKKEMRPTHAGRIYIENARRILKMAQNCVSQINDLSDNPCGTHRICSGTELMASIHPWIIRNKRESIIFTY
jgi:DNA-binding transcriptional LysR family regulator